VLFFGALAASTGRLEFLGAGCAPLLYRHASKDFSVMESTMAPLAIFPAVGDGGVTEVTLHPGEVLILATDGFYE
jgi:serine phosphatase RsbU (regulator of sigma subunit)